MSAIGLGCMGMSEFYDPKQMDDEGSIRVIHRYLDAGGNFLDTADMYGMGRNEVLGVERGRVEAAVNEDKPPVGVGAAGAGKDQLRFLAVPDPNQIVS